MDMQKIFAIPDKVYDILKAVAMVILPAIGTLYSALAGIWGWPHGEQIVGSIIAIDTFIGVVLGISSMQYKKSKANTHSQN